MKSLLLFFLIACIPVFAALVLLHAHSSAATAEELLQSPLPQDRHDQFATARAPLPTAIQTITITPQPTRDFTPPPMTISPTPALDTVVSEALSETTGTYSVVIKNLKTGQWYRKDEHRVYDSGSLYKLWVMATAYHQIEAGTLQHDAILSEDIATLNRIFQIDPEDAELTDGGITLSVDDALNQMITISHNYAAMLLSEKVHLSKVATFLQDNGLTESTVGTTGASPTITADDAALFLEKLYRGQLGNKQSTQQMMNLLKAQKLNNKLPKYLPDTVVVAHKTGEINQFSHDIGIVYADAGPYIIVVLSESDNPSAAEERMARLSQTVYQYFSP